MSTDNLVPAGIYPAVAVVTTTDKGEVWAQLGETKDSGTKQVVVNLQIVEGPCIGRRLPWFGFFTAKSVDRTLDSLRYMGFKGDDLFTLPSQPLNQRVEIVVEHDTWNDKTRAKVAWVNRPSGGGMKLAKPMDTNALRTFAAQVKGRLKARPEVVGDRVTVVVAPTSNGTEEPPMREPGDDRDELGF